MRLLKNTLLRSAIIIAIIPLFTFGLGNLTNPVLAAVKKHDTTTGWVSVSGYDNVVLTDVSCADTTDCTAVGNYGTATGGPAVVAITGTSGNVGTVSYYESPSTVNGTFNGVSCASAANCIAVGFLSDTGGYFHPAYARESNGAWGNAQELSTPAGSDNNEQFTSISCADASDCVAVGMDQYPTTGGTSSIPMYAIWSNGSWGPVTELHTPTGFGEVYGVSCSDAGDCVIVGEDTDSVGDLNSPIEFTYSSGSWAEAAEISSPNPTQTTLNSVSCVDSQDCTAIGQATDSFGNSDNLAITVESQGVWGEVQYMGQTGTGQLSDISCVSAGNCTAVGWDAVNGNPLYIIEAAGTWGSVTPVQTGSTAFLNGVGCAENQSTISCTAVGENEDGSLIGYPFGDSQHSASNLKLHSNVKSSSYVKGALLLESRLSRYPAAPSNVNVSIPATGKIAVRWQAPSYPGSSKVTGYTVSVTSGKQIISRSVSGLSYTFSGLKTTNEYTIGVTARNSVGSSLVGQAQYQVYPVTSTKLTVKAAPVVVQAGSSFNLLAYGVNAGATANFSTQGSSYSCKVNILKQCFVAAAASSQAGVYKAKLTVGASTAQTTYFVPLIQLPQQVKAGTKFKMTVTYSCPRGLIKATAHGITYSLKASSKGTATLTLRAASSTGPMTIDINIFGTIFTPRTITVT